MKCEKIADLMASVVAVEERSLTCAAARLSMTQSVLGQIVRRVEERLGLQLLTRVTRGAIPTEAGEYLLSVLGPMLHNIDPALTSLSDLQSRPSGAVRTITVEHATKTILLPAMRTLLKSRPETGTQLTIGHGLTDVVSERFDVGIRLGGEMNRDMIAIRIGPDIPIAIVGPPDYFSRRGAPALVSQLIDYQVINLCLPISGTANHWRLIHGGRKIRVRMEGQLSLNTVDLIVDTTIDRHGLAYLPYDQIERATRGKKLIRVLDKFIPDLPGYRLYYPRRRHTSSVFPLFTDRLKYKGAVWHYLLIHQFNSSLNVFSVPFNVSVIFHSSHNGDRC